MVGSFDMVGPFEPVETFDLVVDTHTDLRIGTTNPAVLCLGNRWNILKGSTFFRRK